MLARVFLYVGIVAAVVLVSAVICIIGIGIIKHATDCFD